MKYNFPPKSIDQLIETLLIKGMIIDDIPSAKQHISCIGYFRLKRFMVPFHVPDGKGDYSFIPYTNFYDIIDIYKFDSQLRVIIFEAIANIEVAFKSLLNYTMTIRHGTHWYLNSSLFKPYFATNLDPNYESGYDKFILKLTKDCTESPEIFVRRYKLNFSDPPLPPSWIVMEIMSFGMSCILYQNILDTEDRSEISTQFNINQNIFETWLITMSYVRNQCAHHQKIIERTFMFPPIIPKRDKNRFLAEHDKIESDSLYAVLCIIQNSLQNLKIDSLFKDSLVDLIEYNPQVNLTNLGFTENWRDEKIWQ